MVERTDCKQWYHASCHDVHADVLNQLLSSFMHTCSLVCSRVLVITTIIALRPDGIYWIQSAHSIQMFPWGLACVARARTEHLQLNKWQETACTQTMRCPHIFSIQNPASDFMLLLFLAVATTASMWGGPFILQRGQYNTLGNYYLQVHFLVILGLNFVIFTCEWDDQSFNCNAEKTTS